MAWMAMKKNLDERARKKEFDKIFLKFDHNKNAWFFYINYYKLFLRENTLGKIHVKDFLREIKMQFVKVGDADLENLCKITDKSGQVKLKLGNKG